MDETILCTTSYSKPQTQPAFFHGEQADYFLQILFGLLFGVFFPLPITVEVWLEARYIKVLIAINWCGRVLSMEEAASGGFLLSGRPREWVFSVADYYLQKTDTSPFGLSVVLWHVG